MVILASIYRAVNVPHSPQGGRCSVEPLHCTRARTHTRMQAGLHSPGPLFTLGKLSHAI